MKRKKERCLPLEHLKMINAAYPDAWEHVERLRAANFNGESLAPWKPWCYVTIATACTVAAAANDAPEESMETLDAGRSIAALAPWRLNKSIFIIDPDLEETLYAQTGELKIPSEILMHLPFSCAYIQASKLAVTNYDMDGFFVHLEDDPKKGDRELRFLFLTKDEKAIAYPLHLDCPTLEEGVARIKEEALQAMREMTPRTAESMEQILNIYQEALDLLAESLRKAVQLVLYICAANAEISARNPTANYNQRSDRITDKFTEIRKWNVGFRTGAALRKANALEAKSLQDRKSSERSTHTPPRPHARRGHWHHFWIGPRSDVEKRKLILKWVAPTIVGLPSDDAPVVFRNVY